MTKKDPFLGILGAIVDSAVAPVIAACEVISDGKVSDSTADTIAKSMAQDAVTDAMLGDKK